LSPIETKCGRRVLVVEDDADVRQAVLEVLADQDYDAIAATNGAEALKRLHSDSEANKPCLILLDVMMPVMDGWAFRAAQTSDPELRKIPVVVLTAHGSAQRVAIDMKVDGFLRKPVDLETLIATVHKYCDRG
jgi:CheY-like chemotaxis protein